MSKGKIIGKRKKIFWLVCLTVLFIAGLWAVDVSVTTLNAGGYLQSLIFPRIDPRIHYHFGLVLSTICYLILALLYIHEVIK